MEMLVTLAVTLLVLVPLATWISRNRSRLAGIAVGSIGLLLVIGLTVVFRPTHVPESEIDNRPIAVAGEDDVTSSACRSCHPDQYATWNASYHSSMTQLPSDETILAPWNTSISASFSNEDGTYEQRTYRFIRRGDEFWVQSDDPAFEKGITLPAGMRQIVMITGSHHEQFFWYSTGDQRKVGQLPVVYSIQQKRWVPWTAVLLGPGIIAPEMKGSWNIVCVRCHSTHGRPGAAAAKLDANSAGVSSDMAGQMDTQVTEFGIACESCHGPGKAHVEANQNPVARYAKHFRDEGDETIVNPARLDSHRANDVCANCHSIHQFGSGSPEDVAEFFESGYEFRPGDDLSETRLIARYQDRNNPAFANVLNLDPAFFETRFWPDGMSAVNGREMNGLLESACFQNTDLSCLSCHQMHQTRDDPRPTKEWANDQLAHDRLENAACLECHESYRDTVAEHTHHPAGSSGSLCYNCHMPHTGYGLMKQTRSHEIDIPRIADTLDVGRPNACNLCHLDKTLAWTANTLEAWYGTEAPAFEDPQHYFISSAVLQALRGDAVVRAMIAWHMGWGPAIEASGGDWMIPLLATLLEDPYMAVRYLSGQSLGAHTELGKLEFEYLAAPADLAASRERTLAAWEKAFPPSERATGEAILIDASGRSNRERIERFLEKRDDRTVYRME